MIAVHAAVDAHVFHRTRQSLAVLHRPVLDARLRRLHARSCDPRHVAQYLEWREIPRVSTRSARRDAAAQLRQLRPAVELVGRRRALAPLMSPQPSRSPIIGCLPIGSPLPATTPRALMRRATAGGSKAATASPRCS